jgi:hypothetical protein
MLDDQAIVCDIGEDRLFDLILRATCDSGLIVVGLRAAQ